MQGVLSAIRQMPYEPARHFELSAGGPHLFVLLAVFLFLESDFWNVRNFLTRARSALRSSLFHPRYVAHRRFRARFMVFIWRGRSAALRRGALPAARLAIKPSQIRKFLVPKKGFEPLRRCRH